MAGTFAALRLRDFRILWISTFFSFLAFFMSTVVQSVVAFDLSGSNRSVVSSLTSKVRKSRLLIPIRAAPALRAHSSSPSV